MKTNRTILFVEDDAVVVTTYRNLLQREGFHIESAGDGLEALKALSQGTPDLVVLDLMLPKFDGADVLKFIRADPRLKTLPIIIFSNAQVKDFAEDPITRQLCKTDCTPAGLLQSIREMLGDEAASGAHGNGASRADQSNISKSRLANGSSTAGSNEEDEGAENGGSQTKERAAFLKDAPAEIAKVRECCLAYIKSPSSSSKLEPLVQSVQSLHSKAGKAGCARIALMAKAFEMLLNKIVAKPSRVTPSILQTLAEAADCLGQLLKSDEAVSDETTSRGKILAVDDDTVCNQVIVNTLKRANLDITTAEDPFEGLEKLQKTRYDLVLLDIDMPKLTGFEVCEKLRSLPQYKTTPVIFVTAHSNLGNRTQSVLSGGNYFITKPVDPLELALKVTIHLFKSQMQRDNPSPMDAKPEAKAKAVSTVETAPKPAAAAPANPQQSNGNGSANGTVKNGDSHGVNAPPVQPRPANISAVTSKPAPPELKTAPPIQLSPARNGGAKDPVAAPSLSSAPPLPPLNVAAPAKPKAVPVPKVLPPPSAAPGLGESGTLNGNNVAGSRNRNSIMNNENDEVFDKVVLAVVRIIFGDDNLTEMNIRLVRIALERYNVHEIINSPVAA